MKLLRYLGIMVVCLVVLGATAYAAGFATSRNAAVPGPVVSTGSTNDGPTTMPSSTPTRTPTVPSTPTETPEPGPVLEPGDQGELVRELQSRLFQLQWFPELTTGSYDAVTQDAVAGFQAKRGFEATGVVDERTWRRLVAMTETPTHDAMFNILRPGPALLAPASRPASSRSSGTSATSPAAMTTRPSRRSGASRPSGRSRPPARSTSARWTGSST